MAWHLASRINDSPSGWNDALQSCFGICLTKLTSGSTFQMASFSPGLVIFDLLLFCFLFWCCYFILSLIFFSLLIFFYSTPSKMVDIAYFWGRRLHSLFPTLYVGTLVTWSHFPDVFISCWFWALQFDFLGGCHPTPESIPGRVTKRRMKKQVRGTKARFGDP